MVTPAGTTRAEDPLGQVVFLTKLAEAVPAANIHRQAIRENQHQSLTALSDGKGVKAKSSPAGLNSLKSLETESSSNGNIS
ncbi:hypothetical protein [Halobacillus sp. K22]|uniref:hypothetical protein n=1 Tax=Halobacillus sp. K22 TaxID=3457431 RepID=UPI003FCC7383